MAKIFLYGVQGQYGNYCAALRAAGLEPVLSRDLYRSFDCAGLLLPGGGDIGAALDGTDQFLIESFTETRRPVLGICRGMQAINVYFGGTLHRWIPGHQQPQGDLLMLRCLRRVFDEGGGVVADQADPDMKSLFQLALKVSHERTARRSASATGRSRSGACSGIRSGRAMRCAGRTRPTARPYSRRSPRRWNRSEYM